MARGKYGAGTAVQRPDGTWMAQWSAGRDASGRRLRGTVSGYPTEAAARKAMTEARGKSSSTSRRRGGETVGAFLGRWLEDAVKPTRRERTYWGYRSIVEHHLEPAFGDVALVSLTRRQVQTWVNRQECAPMTTRHRLDCLRAAMSRAVRWGLIPANPAKEIDLPAVTRPAVRALGPEDARAILAACEETWFAPLVTVALYTGLRQGELLGLRWEDVTLADAGGSVSVRYALARLPGPRGIRYVLDQPKSNRSRRTVPLAAPAAEALRSLRRAAMSGKANRHNLVFANADGTPIDGTRLTHDFQDALKAAGVPRMTWHQLRHGFVTMSMAAGMPIAVVSQLAGHSGIAITSDIYGHLTEDSKREAIERLARYVG